MYQFDLLYMPHDKLYGNTYKYILTGIDVASRYKPTRPLRTKKASEVADMLKDIYKAGPLRYSSIFHCDNGSEFKSAVSKLLESKGVEIRRATTKYHHTYTAFVESYNKVLAEKLFKPQDAQELVTDKQSSTWVKHLYTIVKDLNNTKTAMIGTKPSKAIKLEVPLAKSEGHPQDKPLPDDGLYFYLLQHEKSMVMLKDEQQMLGGAKRHGPDRSVVSEELMLVPEGVKVPPEHVKECGELAQLILVSVFNVNLWFTLIPTRATSL
ncbi:uncharacterized protein LOC130648296 [Hydractinia symbiolongicarpus]|uniref:uncharacterized protein LOC130648296 n=1 Tax=Hydractinia symbiolongicarpus TaxID=13093 RepID=UPI00254E2C56|nr:uncharacterized protein LOC130648296 [Hydractinia symbiolongicarpus]